MARFPAWFGVSESRWTKGPDQEFRPAKTLWDWLQLLIVPAVLALGAIAFTASQSARDAKREDARVTNDRNTARIAQLDSVLEAYLTQMSDLVLNRGLQHARADSDTRVIAHTLTVSALRRLDGSRRGEVVRFLAEAGLIRNTADPIIELSGANLQEADLTNSGLKHISLSGADLRKARFDEAGIEFSNLSG